MNYFIFIVWILTIYTFWRLLKDSYLLKVVIAP